MKKLAALLLSALFLLPLTACRTKETASRAETVQERYAALTSYTAAAAVELADEEENVRYTLRFDADAEETKVTVLAPELLAGVTAHLAADTLKLEYDGLVLDAGGTPGGVSAVTCVPLALRAAGEGWLTERSEEEIEYGGGTCGCASRARRAAKRSNVRSGSARTTRRCARRSRKRIKLPHIWSLRALLFVIQ